MSMTPQELLAQMADAGLEELDNSLFAGRLPPDDTAGMFPAGEYEQAYPDDHTVTANLIEELPEALAKPIDLTAEYNQAAQVEIEPAIMFDIPGLG